ncbi:MAG: tetratricopeptide repeat protein, partial [Muribaculaceae bacterium]|nr:tetratricopeptide repeat protein [Muribaculaceae bacterium]
MRKIFALLTIAVLGCQAVGAQNSAMATTKAERNAVKHGNEYFEEGNFAKALENYEVALQLNPASQIATYNKALALLNMATDDTKGTEHDPRRQAMELLQQVGAACEKTDSALAEKAFYNLGNMAFNDEDYAQSIERYKQALRINPDNNRTRQNLRLAQLKKQEQEQNKDQDKQDQQQQQQQQQQQEQQQQEQQQQQQQQQQPMTQSAEQILQAMQNKENATRRKQKEPAQPV